jgi:hypothetical protein
MAVLMADRAAANSYTFVDNVGNTYTILQPTTSSSIRQMALAVCASTTVAIPNGSTWKATFSPSGLANWSLCGTYYRPPPPTGSTTVRVSNVNSSASNITSLSTTLAGVQTNDLVIGLVGTTNGQDYYITDPAGFNPLLNIPPMSLSSQIAAASGTMTFNPSWPNASPAVIIAVALANANIAT